MYTAHTNSQKIEHPLKSNQALIPGNGKKKKQQTKLIFKETLLHFMKLKS